ncbi:hypothetical protein J3R83DRAFT_9564 [Lanmaoa asiatica]|nr:hypothetical protein J3R83DRAFT_9564 [Lanmaoa asiatica]
MSLSDISDLTDLSTDEDDVPLAKRTSKARKVPKEYKVSHVLRAPRTAQYTAKSLYDQIIDNAIDLDPEYQRDVIWQEEKQSGLIDSVLRNYYIPPIIFAVTVQDDGNELRTCIDGKQRLTSIQRYSITPPAKRVYKLNTSFRRFTNEKLWFKSSATNARRKLLPQHLRTQFANKQIVCVEYTGLDDDQEREIFQASKRSPTSVKFLLWFIVQRVQLGVALTPAERLQALVGPWSTAIREIQNQVLGEEGFEGYLDWGHARGRDFQCLATIGYLIETHPKTAVPGTKVLEKWLQKTQPVSTQLRADLHETFRIFVTLARDKKYSGSLNRPTRVSPIEFVMIGVLIYLKRQTLSLTQISSAIEKMRKDVRASHQDIRSNTRVTKHLMEFMAKKIKVSELRSDGEGDKPAALAIVKATKPAKRKRPVYSDDSDTEPTPKVKPTKHSTNPTRADAVKSSKQTSGASDQKTSGTKKAAVTPAPKTSLSSKPVQPSTSSRTTNNSLSNLFPVPAKNSSLLTPATRSRTPPPPPSTSNGNNVQLRSTTSNSARHAPLTVHTSSMVKVESPQFTSLNSPATLSAVDRLAPIRAAKASLASGVGAQSPSVSKGSEIWVMPSPGASTFQTPVDLRQIPAVSQPAVHRTTVSSQQQPLLPPSVQSSSQHLPANPQLEGVLRALRSQFPQLGYPAQSMNNGAVNSGAFGQNVQSSGIGDHPISPTIPGFVNTGSANDSGHTYQGYGVGTPQEAHNGNISSTQANPNQARSEPNAVPPWPSLGMSGNVNLQQQQPTMNFSTPTSAGLHALPQRPAVVASTPSNSMRAEPLGPPSRSVSSESTIPDNRRGPYNKDRHRPSDDRRPKRYDRNQNFDRTKRNWFHPRS